MAGACYFNGVKNISGMKQKSFKFNVLIALLLLSFSGKSQILSLSGGDSAYASKLEFGLAVYTSDVREYGIYNDDPIPYRGNYFFNGVYFRFWKNNNAYRFLLNHYADEEGLGQYYQDNNIPFFEGSGFQPTFSGKTRNAIEIKGGLQLLLFNSRLSPYFTADLGYRYTVEKSYMSYTTIEFQQPVVKTVLYSSESSQFGFYGGLGMKYQLTSKIVIGFETQMSINYALISSEIPGLRSAQGFRRGLQPGQFTLGFYL